jgi:hypothetical protein
MKLWWIFSEKPGQIRLIWAIVLIALMLVGLTCTAPSDTGREPFAPAAVHFTYKGHDYIKFGGTRVGYVHDPDCRCGIE